MICSECWKNMVDNFNFKATCIYTEDYIHPFIKEAEKLNLFKICYDKESECGSICRLCRKRIPAESMYLNESERRQFDTYFPEVVSTYYIL